MQSLNNLLACMPVSDFKVVVLLLAVSVFYVFNRFQKTVFCSVTLNASGEFR